MDRYEFKVRGPKENCVKLFLSSEEVKTLCMESLLDLILTRFTGLRSKENVKPWSQDWLIAAGAYPGFCSMKRLGVFLLLLDEMLVHRRSPFINLLGFPNNSPVPIYTPGWREAL